jgi:DNA-binding MarR family transcriptional regulator
MSPAGAPTRVSRDEVLRHIEEEMGILVRRLKRTIAERARALDPGLKGTSYLLLGWLAQHGPVRPSAVVEALGTDKGAISRQLQHLEELGYVARTPDPSDGRATLVSATGPARDRLAEIDRRRREQLDARLGDWSAEELDDLVTQLGRYNRSLDGITLS